VGKEEYIAKIRKAPMMRALRVDKLTLAALGSVTRSYVTDTTLRENVPLFLMLGQSDEELRQRADELAKKLHACNVSACVVKSVARCGGGTLPSLEIPSYAVQLVSGKSSQKECSEFAERIFNNLHQTERPIIGILRQGEISFDVFTLEDKDLSSVADEIFRVLGEKVMKHLIMGTAGHVDHGKTALIKTLTQIDCDTHEEEKRRGITIHLGFAHMNLKNGESLGIVDVPGHKDFIHTMVGGASGNRFCSHGHRGRFWHHAADQRAPQHHENSGHKARADCAHQSRSCG